MRYLIAHRRAGLLAVLVDDDTYESQHQYKWRIDKNGYVVRRAGKRLILLHHEIIGRPAPGYVVDHKNGVRFDARRRNLRFATQTQNAANRHCVRSRTGYKGVTWHAQCRRYQAQCKVAGVNHYLGLHDDPIDAARAYADAACKHFGAFAWASVPPSDIDGTETREAA